MDTRINVTKPFYYAVYALIVIGAGLIAYGFITQPDRAWANLLLNNYYFLSLSIGASFFIAIQYISQSGWSSMFKRVPEAMMAFIPYSGVVMLLLYFGMHSLYHWSDPQVLASDPLVQHKAPYLNIPFFFIRMLLFFLAWTIMTRLLRKASLEEDANGGMAYFEKSELISKIHIFLLAITFSLAAFDWIMSIEVHWFSTIFALRDFVGSFYRGSAAIALIVIVLHQRGYFPGLNKSHLLDFSRYIFMLCIIWGYFTFSQFMLIWYGNIPEETVYFYNRWHHGFKLIFYANFIINWFLPFVLMLSQVTNKNIHVVKAISILILVGLYVDLYEQIFPGVVHAPLFGIIEIGFFLGFGGLFTLIIVKALAKANLIPKNHPYLEESLHHHVH